MLGLATTFMWKIRVLLRKDQMTAIDSLSAQTSQTRSDIIRDAVDLLLEKRRGSGLDWKEATRAVAGIWRNRADIDRLHRHIPKT